MITQEDYNFISRFDTADAAGRDTIIKEQPMQLPKTFINLLNQLSKDQTIMYLLTILDDTIQVSNSKWH